MNLKGEIWERLERQGHMKLCDYILIFKKVALVGAIPASAHFCCFTVLSSCSGSLFNASFIFNILFLE